MTVNPSIDHARMLEEHLAQASHDMLRELLGSFINTLLSADADAVCGAEYGVASIPWVLPSGDPCVGLLVRGIRVRRHPDRPHYPWSADLMQNGNAARNRGYPSMNRSGR